MKKPGSPWKIVIGAGSALAVIAVLVLALFLDSRSPKPIFGIFHAERNGENETANSLPAPESTEERATDPKGEQSDKTEGNKDPLTEPAEEEAKVPATLPAAVTLPTKLDPATGAPQGLSFPCQVPGYGLVLEKMAPYSGLFVEDGESRPLSDVGMILVKNNGKVPVEYALLTVDFGSETLQFDISALPAGEQAVVQEKTGKKMPGTSPLSAKAQVFNRAQMEMNKDRVLVTDNGDNTLTIQNLSQETLPTVRIFYKYYMEEENVFVGGIAFSLRITSLAPGAKLTVSPNHFASGTSRVVMVQIYDNEN